MIQFNNITKRFRRARVLDDISLNIDAGERIALIGSNGAGKTTLIRCLLGEYTYQGKITIDGLEPRRHRTTVLSSIGFVPQLPPPLKMPVGQLINFSASLCGTPPQSIHTIAERLGLDVNSIRSRPFIRLSGGMKQKLLIAIALGRDTRILVMDEPAANLDPEARKIFFDMLAERLGNTTMILSSHRLDEVSSLVSRVIEMDMGKIALDDVVADTISLTGALNCRIIIKRPEPAFSKALEGWNFICNEDACTWEGQIAAPDRLRFLGVISRYTALISDFSLTEQGEDDVQH